MGKRDKGDFMSRAGRITKAGYRKTADVTRKGAGRIARSYKKYGKPTEMLFRKTGAGVLGVGKFALKRGALGFPGLVATGLYLGAKGIAKRQKGLSFSSFRQFNKKGRKVL